MMNSLDMGNLLGFLAAGLVLTTFAMRTMMTLRLVGIAGNVAFIAYGLYQGLMPVVALHVMLLPLNIWRAIEIADVTRRIRHAQQLGIDVSSLVPLMQQTTWQPGHRLFSKGDEARHLYVIIEGTVSIPEHGVELGSGSLVGEMGIFVPGCRRTASAVCVTQCQLGSLSYQEVERIYFQKPEFGFALISLLATRFNDNERKLRLQLEA
jgi:hypothetical protein